MEMRILLLGLTTFLFGVESYGQTKDLEFEGKFSVRLHFEPTMTFHYNEPIHLDLCDEDCFIDEQNPSATLNTKLSVLYSLNYKTKIVFGVGRTLYQFNEIGRIGDGSGMYNRYNVVRSLDILSVFTGLRRSFNVDNKVRPYTEIQVACDILLFGEERLRNHSIAANLGAGIEFDIGRSFVGFVGGHFGSGLENYANGKVGEKYIPYGYGLEMGVEVFL